MCGFMLNVNKNIDYSNIGLLTDFLITFGMFLIFLEMWNAIFGKPTSIKSQLVGIILFCIGVSRLYLF